MHYHLFKAGFIRLAYVPSGLSIRQSVSHPLSGVNAAWVIFTSSPACIPRLVFQAAPA